jgi:hypothetical protein
MSSSDACRSATTAQTTTTTTAMRIINTPGFFYGQISTGSGDFGDGIIG